MASVKKKQRKNGSFFYEISVSRGYSKSPYTMRWDIPEGLATKTVKARLRDVAVKFEQDCKNGKVKTRKERKEELQQAELKRIVCVLGLVGCNQKAVSASEVYSFPEPTTMITVSFYSQGEETAFEIGSEEYDSNDLSTTPVINWFYDLKLTACDEPEAVEGSESYEFYVKGESAFTYEDRGSEAYIIIGGSYYKVSNPSAPPIN